MDYSYIPSTYHYIVICSVFVHLGAMKAAIKITITIIIILSAYYIINNMEPNKEMLSWNSEFHSIVVKRFHVADTLLSIVCAKILFVVEDGRKIKMPHHLWDSGHCAQVHMHQ